MRTILIIFLVLSVTLSSICLMWIIWAFVKTIIKAIKETFKNNERTEQD